MASTNRFSAIFTKWDNFCDFLFVYLYLKPLFFSIMEGFAPKEQSFSFLSRPLQTRKKNIFDRADSFSSVSIPHKITTIPYLCNILLCYWQKVGFVSHSFGCLYSGNVWVYQNCLYSFFFQCFYGLKQRQIDNSSIRIDQN